LQTREWELSEMLDAVARLMPPVNKFLEQIWPSVVATLIAAGLISGYNHAFQGHLQQPRMAALHEAAGVEPAAAPAATTVVTKPAQGLVDLTLREPAPARVAEKDPVTEAGKDQTAVKIVAPAPAPAAPRPATVASPAPRTEPRAVERRIEPRLAEPRVTAVPYVVPPAAGVVPPAAGPVTVAPLAPPPFVAAAPAPLPPPVIMAAPAPSAAQQPTVTVPDRPYQRAPYPPYEAQAEDVPPPPQGPIGAIVNTLKPSSLLARAREFGERIEAAGNEILPNIRQ
jgi:hypothetical protein